MTEFPFSQHMQDSLLLLGLMDDDVARYISLFVEPDNFQSEYARFTCKRLQNFYNEFHSAPKEHFADIVESALNGERAINERKAPLYRKYFDNMFSLTPNKDYVLKNLNIFLKHQALTTAIIKGAELVKVGKLEDAERAVLDGLRSGIANIDFGLDYTGDKAFISIPEIVCYSLIPPLDNNIEGFRRKDLLVWLAATNVGKSWALIHTGKAALLQGKRVLHYILADMDVEWLKTRYDMSISGMGTKDKEIQTSSGGTMHVKSLFDNQQKVLQKRKFAGSIGGKLILKGPPIGGLTINKLKAEIEMLESARGFSPDIVLIDYADHMKPDRHYNERRHELGGIYLGLKEIATEHNLHMQTASQTNRGGMDAQLVTLKHFQEDIQKAQHADIVISICQTPAEEHLRVMRLFGCKNRNERKGWHIEMRYCYELGQFSLHSHEITQEDLAVRERPSG